MRTSKNSLFSIWLFGIEWILFKELSFLRCFNFKRTIYYFKFIILSLILNFNFFELLVFFTASCFLNLSKSDIFCKTFLTKNKLLWKIKLCLVRSTLNCSYQKSSLKHTQNIEIKIFRWCLNQLCISFICYNYKF